MASSSRPEVRGALCKKTNCRTFNITQKKKMRGMFTAVRAGGGTTAAIGTDGRCHAAVCTRCSNTPHSPVHHLFIVVLRYPACTVGAECPCHHEDTCMSSSSALRLDCVLSLSLSLSSAAFSLSVSLSSLSLSLSLTLSVCACVCHIHIQAQALHVGEGRQRAPRKRESRKSAGANAGEQTIRECTPMDVRFKGVQSFAPHLLAERV